MVVSVDAARRVIDYQDLQSHSCGYRPPDGIDFVVVVLLVPDEESFYFPSVHLWVLLETYSIVVSDDDDDDVVVEFYDVP